MDSTRRGLYVERLTAGSTTASRMCLLITRKIIIPPPDSGDPPDGPPYLAKKRFPLSTGTHQLHLRSQGSASEKKMICPPDCWDPPATSSYARKCLTVGTHLVEAYVVLSFWSRTCTYIYTGRCRGAHVACTRTYSGQGARKKIRPCICTYGRALECLLAHTYGQGSCTWLGRNGETASSSCSWGANRLGRNGMCRRVHREGLYGTGDGNEA